MDINVRIAGEAGQGVQTTGAVLVDALARGGYHVFATQSYMSRIRGGMNWCDVRIADRELFAGTESVDVLVALTEDALGALIPTVRESGLILSDGPWHEKAVSLGFAKVASEVAGTSLTANSVAAGAVFAVLGCDLSRLLSYLETEFRRKGTEVVEKNVRCARRGAELASSHAGTVAAPPASGAATRVYAGAEAVGLAAATAGVKFVTSYPMSPSTAVLNVLASLSDRYGIVVEQAEDEIAAVNMVCGATYAGVPAMTTTSGGGFSLMVEGLSLAGTLELPVFILLGQRPGPATGLPTRTAQEDLRFAISAGHGEFPRAVFAPGTLAQSYEITRHALQCAHKWQTPVILLADQFLLDQSRNQPSLDDTYRPIDRCVVENPPGDYVRYQVTPDGVSPRALPGSAAYVISGSDEHTEDGHLTEDLGARVRLQEKRMAKQKGLAAEALPPELYGPEDARLLLVAWGSTYGPCREAVDILNESGGSAAMLHFSQVWPLELAVAARALRNRTRIAVVEGNSTGQFASVLKQMRLLDECEAILRYDGLPFTGQEIAERARQ
jgi:2-oxoglutarate ferredoxin oxidoreductase subunit alpha